MVITIDYIELCADMKQREAKITAANKQYVGEALERLAQFYTDWGQPEKAATWQQQLDALNATASRTAAGK